MAETEVVVRLEALASGGAVVGVVVGVVPAGPAQILGKKIFVRGAIPGELIRAAIIEEHSSYLKGELVAVLEASPERRRPPCPLFGHCGGCDLQQLEDQPQRRLKLEMIGAALAKQGGLHPSRGWHCSSEGLSFFHYRQRVALHLSPMGEIGFFKHGSGEVVPLERCLLADERINAALPQLQGLVADHAVIVGQILLELGSGGLQVLLKLRPEYAKASLRSLKERFQALAAAYPGMVVLAGRRSFSLDSARQPSATAGSFSQVNAAGNRRLVETVLANTPIGELTELYAGAGNFTLPLAQAGARIEAVELDAALTAAGRLSLAAAALADSVKWYSASAEHFVKHNALRPTLLLDPPRSGAKAVLSQCRPEQVKHITYVSCSLPTLTRDLKILSAQGYALESVYFIDMFPQTAHVETVSVLKAAL